MLSENSLFTKIPTIISLKQRLILEGAGMAIESIDWSFGKLRSGALQLIGYGQERPPVQMTREMIFYCWSLIDNCHMLRQMLKYDPLCSDPTTEFLKRYGDVTRIRNSMDHLHSNLNNLASLKTSRPPLLGAFSFCAIEEQHWRTDETGNRKIDGGKLFLVTAGAFTHREHSVSLPDPWDERGETPVGRFQFHAFDYVVRLSDLVNDLAKLVQHHDTVTKAGVERQIREYARENGLDEAKELATYLVSDITTIINITMDDEDRTPRRRPQKNV